jgi:hypothetical protein
MNSARVRPLALWRKSSRAGQRLLRLRSARPAPRVISLLEFMASSPGLAKGKPIVQTKPIVRDRRDF